MALNDRFNRSGDSWLTRFDAYLTNQADRVGEWWAAHTAWDRHTLTQGILALSAFAALERVVLLHDVLYLLVAFAILQSFIRRVGAPVGGLLEEIQYEAAGLPRWTPSAVNVLILFSGLFGLSTVAGSILASALSGIAPTVAILDPLLSGVAFAGWKIGEYIARTNPSGPNGKPRRSEA